MNTTRTAVSPLPDQCRRCERGATLRCRPDQSRSAAWHGVILAAALGESFPGEAAIVRDGSLPYHLTIHELPSNIRPRERLQALGPEALSDDELIAIILRTGTQARNVLDVARELVARHGGLDGVGRASEAELAGTSGIGPVKAIDLKAAFELGKRLMTWAPDQQPEITGPEGAYALLSAKMSRLEREEVRVILLNTKNRVQSVAEVSAGSLNSSIIRVAEVFKDAVRQQAAAIVLAHNHPSGAPRSA
jgi:DNA repair protein RadC